MTNKLKTYAVLTLLIIGFVFLAGCAGKNSDSSSPTQETSSEGVPTEKTNASEAQSIALKGSDTVLPLAQAEAEIHE